MAEEKEFKRIEATGKYVVLRCERVCEKQVEIVSAGGIIIPGQENQQTGKEVARGGAGEKVKVDMFIESIGPLVENDKYGFKVGELVIANNYDLQFFGARDDVFYACTQADSIKCVIEPNE